MLDLELHVFDLRAVAFDGSDYTGDCSNDVRGGSSDCERQGESDDKDKRGKGDRVHF